MNKELKKALFTLLYDQYDIPDMQLDDSEEYYIDYIVLFFKCLETNIDINYILLYIRIWLLK